MVGWPDGRMTTLLSACGIALSLSGWLWRSDPNLSGCSENACTASMRVCKYGSNRVSSSGVCLSLLFHMTGLVHCRRTAAQLCLCVPA